MPVIIVSSDLYRTGREIAESAARVLGYGFLGREILGQVAEKYEVPEAKLAQALDEGPSFLRRSSKLRHRYLAYIQEGALFELHKGNVVCQGLAAHLYVLGVSHVLRVRILSDTEKRAEHLATERGISPNKAKRLLDREKKAHQRWSMETFQLDETDPSHYDLVINLSQIDSAEAVKIIRETVSYPRFKPMTYSLHCMEDLALSSRVKALLWERFPGIRVRADRGTLVIETAALKREKEKKVNAIKELAGKIPGVEYVEVHIDNHIFRPVSRSFR
ncbi:MAG: cytidylate kinase-like family protein [Desulfatiglandaceae bacterium]